MYKKIILYFFVFFNIDFGQICKCNDIYESLISLSNLLDQRSDIVYNHLSNSEEILCRSFKDNIDLITYPKKFMLSIPNGQVYSSQGLVVVDHMYIDDLIWGPTKRGVIFPLPDIKNLNVPEVIHGKVAVGLQAGAWNYYHWMTEVLPRLGLLQASGIKFDYLYLPLDYSFMRETVNLLGFDASQILQPQDFDFHIQADELIVPSMIYVKGHISPFTIDFLRNRFIPLAEKKIDSRIFSKKIFISRRSAKKRKIANEDEVFELFKEYGFVRYDLENLSVLEQVALFNNADIVAGEHGAGFTNIIFSQPATKILEIFQAKKRVMFWNLSQRLGLNHTCIKTIEYNTKQNELLFSTIPLKPIKDAINALIKS